MKLVVIFALFAFAIGKKKENSGKNGYEEKPGDDIEEEPYGEGKGKPKIVKKEGKSNDLPKITNLLKREVIKPEMDIGKFTELKHGVSGKVSTSAVSYEEGKEEKKRTLEITDFNYNGKGT